MGSFDALATLSFFIRNLTVLGLRPKDLSGASDALDSPAGDSSTRMRCSRSTSASVFVLSLCDGRLMLHWTRET